MKLYTVTAWIIQTLTQPLRAVLFSRYLHLKISGKENIKKALKLRKEQGVGVLFVANHTSELDQLIIPIGVGMFSGLAPLHYVARAPKEPEYEKERWGWRAFTYRPWFLMMCGGVPVKKKTGDYGIALAPHIKLLKSGKSVVIFPEGTILRETVRAKSRGGVGYVVEAANPIVVPLHITSFLGMKGGKTFWSRERHITLSIGEPVVGQELQESTPVQNQKDEYYRGVGETILDRVYDLGGGEYEN